jgi:hypothetical protein
VQNLATAGAASRPSSPARDQIGTVPMESAVSWSAVFAGAAATAALSLILLILGTGLGLSSVSPWAHDGVSASAIGISAILWITVSQVLASAAGGYIAGRSRFQWSGIHTDEIYFRDTVHGFLAWAVDGSVADFRDWFNHRNRRASRRGHHGWRSTGSHKVRFDACHGGHVRQTR